MLVIFVLNALVVVILAWWAVIIFRIPRHRLSREQGARVERCVTGWTAPPLGPLVDGPRGGVVDDLAPFDGPHGIRSPVLADANHIGVIDFAEVDPKTGYRSGTPSPSAAELAEVDPSRIQTTPVQNPDTPAGEVAALLADRPIPLPYQADLLDRLPPILYDPNNPEGKE